MSLSTVSAAFFFASASVDVGSVLPGSKLDLSIPNATAAHLVLAPSRDVMAASLTVADAPPQAGSASQPEPVEATREARTPLREKDDDGDIIVTGRVRPPPEDPAQAVNMASFVVVQAVDQAVIRPAALAYSSTVPAPIRDGVRNFLDHVTEPVNAVNFLLQHKFGKAFETVGRFLINSTIGVLGIFDMAKRKPFHLPHRANGFGNTLGFYGVGPGPFLYVPLIGPTTVRDLVGIIGNRAFLPTIAPKPFNQPYFYIPSAVLGQIDKRAQLDEELQARKNDTRGEYTATREDYLERRQAAINALHGIYNPKDFPPPRYVPTVGVPKEKAPAPR